MSLPATGPSLRQGTPPEEHGEEQSGTEEPPDEGEPEQAGLESGSPPSDDRESPEDGEENSEHWHDCSATGE